MRWKPDNKPLIASVFAWFPVFCKDTQEYVWWERVHRRWISGAFDGVWEYATKEESLKW